MTPEEMLQDFSQQKDEIVEEIKNLEMEILRKKEQFFRLQGAVEALTLTTNLSKGACLGESCEENEEISLTQIIEDTELSNNN